MLSILHGALIFCQRCIFLALTLMLTSCFGPVKTATSNEYVLTSTPTVYTRHHPNLTLVVLPPRASSVYNSNRMLYVIRPYQINYFVENRWADTPANMLQTLITQTLQNNHVFGTVLAAPFPGQYNLLLRTELLTLQQNFLFHPSDIQLTLRAELINARTAKVIATKLFSVSEPAPQNNPASGVTAANRAVKRLLSELTVFCGYYASK